MLILHFNRDLPPSVLGSPDLGADFEITLMWDNFWCFRALVKHPRACSRDPTRIKKRDRNKRKGMKARDVGGCVQSLRDAGRASTVLHVQYLLHRPVNIR